MNTGSLIMGLNNDFMTFDSKNINTVDNNQQDWEKTLDKATQTKQSNKDYNKKLKEEQEYTTEAKDNKEPSNVIDKKKLGKKESVIESKEVKETEVKDYEALLEDVAQQIMQVLMQHFNLTEDEVKHILEQIEQTPLMLLEQNNFMNFVMEAMDITQEQLLNGEVNLKEITKLFGELEEIKIELENTGVFEHEEFEMPELLQETSNLNEQEMQQGSNPQNQETGAQGITVNTQNIDLSNPTSELLFQMPLVGNKTNVQAQNTLNSLSTHLQKQQLIVDQVIEQIDLSALKKNNEITMQLQPQNLGKLSITVAEKEGIVVAQIKVENEKVKEALLQDIAVLESKLEAQGLTIGSFQVDVKEDSQKFTMEQQKQKSSKRIEEIMNKQLEDLMLEEAQKIEEETRNNDNTINLMA